ncbi:hypothetical protein MRY87_10595 [bacterium]|nr:hypothetical protein [bacterium]
MTFQDPDRQPRKSDGEGPDREPHSSELESILNGLSQMPNAPFQTAHDRLKSDWEGFIRSEIGDGGQIHEISEPLGDAAVRSIHSHLKEALSEALTSVPEESPFRNMKTFPAVAFQAITEEGEHICYAAFELRNTGGQAMAFNGNSLEICRGGPVLTGMWYCPGDPDQDIHEEDFPDIRAFYSPGAFEERHQAFRAPDTGEVSETYMPGYPTHFFTELEEALIEFLGISDEKRKYFELSEVTPSPGSQPGIVDFSSSQADGNARLSRDPSGLLHIEIGITG